MNDKKFDALSIVVSVSAFLLSLTAFSIEGIVAGIIGIVLAVKRKAKYRTKIAMVFSVIAIILGAGFFALLCYHHIKYGMMTDYWFFELLFGKMPE